MKNILIDAQSFSNKAEMHGVLKRAFDLPDYYGNNLDALWDCLTERTGECEVELKNFERADAELVRGLLLLFLDLSRRGGYRLSLTSSYFKPDSMYRHFRGGMYRAVGLGFNSETLEIEAVYRSLADGSLWVRPARMWGETVAPDGEAPQLRFEPFDAENL